MRRMFYNDDGNGGLLQYRGPMRQEMACDSADALVGTPVTTLMLCVSYSDVVTYPSAVAEMYGWRRTPSDALGYHHVYEIFQQVRELGWDIPRIVMARAKELGMEFMPSMRMNDGHFAQKVHPTEHPLTGRFWMEHQDLIINPKARYPGPFHEFLLDFQHEAVREFRLAHAFEIIDRYAADGFEMDWTRHCRFFGPGREQPELITTMVRKVRRRLDECGARENRRLPLVVRVPASIQTSLRIGLDVRSWIKEKLVDYIVPSSPSRCISLDMPISEWLEAVKGTGIEIHPSPDSGAICGNGHATIEMYRAAACNYYAMGAHGFYLFNLFCRGYPLADDAYLIMRDVSHPAALARRDKLFMALPGMDQWRPDADTLPVALAGPETEAKVGIWVGDDLAAAQVDTTLRQAQLQIRLDALGPRDSLQISLNGRELDMATAHVCFPSQKDKIAFNAGIPAWTYERLTLGDEPGIWIIFELKDPLPGLGDNRVSIRRVECSAGWDRMPRVVNINLKVTYDYCGKDNRGS